MEGHKKKAKHLLATKLPTNTSPYYEAIKNSSFSMFPLRNGNVVQNAQKLPCLKLPDVLDRQH